MNEKKPSGNTYIHKETDEPEGAIAMSDRIIESMSD